MSAEQKWTPEPWRASPYSSVVGCVITAQPDPKQNSVRVTSVATEANAARIVACVNKLAGRSDLSAVEIVPAGFTDKAIALLAQRDELLAALRAIQDLDPADTDEGHNEWGEALCFNKAQAIANAALAKVQP